MASSKNDSGKKSTSATDKAGKKSTSASDKAGAVMETIDESMEKKETAVAGAVTSFSSPVVASKSRRSDDDEQKEEEEDNVNETLNSILVLPPLADGGAVTGAISDVYGPSVGAVVGEFKCSHTNKRGTLHLTTKAVCFRSTGFFGFEQARVIIPLATVATIARTEGDKNDGISVTDDSGQHYVFVCMENRDAAFNQLRSIHKKVSNYSARKDKFRDQSVLMKSMQIRRTMSAPTAMLEEEELGQKDTPTEDDILAAAVAAEMADSANDAMRNLMKEIATGKISDQGWAAAKKYRSNQDVPMPFDLRKGWVEVRDAKDPSFNEVVIKELKLSCTFDEYIEYFLSNDAEKSIASFQHEKLGDLDHEVSPWQLSEEDGFSINRVVSYVHPINAPMAPPKAAASKEQSFRRFGDYGVVVQTQTVVRDVPMTDCFFVDDRIMLEPMPEGGICLTAQFEVRFIKRTMFRSIIASTTRSEFVTWFQKYQTFILDTLEEKNKGKKTGEEEEKGEGVKAQVETIEEEGREVALAPAGMSPEVEKYLFALVGLIALLVVMQLLLMIQVRAANNSFLQMSANQEKVFDLFVQMLDTKVGVTGTSCAADEERE